MRVLVCGGRSYSDRVKFADVMDKLKMETDISLIIHGACTGADSLADNWAKSSNIETASFKANWKVGKSAGPTRNRTMLAEGKPDLVVAFPGGRGTADMIKQATAAGIKILQVSP